MNSTFGISIIIPAALSESNIDATVEALDEYLLKNFSVSFEILVVPNPLLSEEDLKNPSIASASFQKLIQNLAQYENRVRIIKDCGSRGKFLAIKTGVFAARGHIIAYYDADLPFGLECFERAFHKIQNGHDLVLGDRRHRDSRIRVPNRLIPRALARECIGLFFNQGVRLFFPAIHFKDTQAGFKMMSRRFARMAFRFQICPGFYGDIELLLVAINSNLRITNVPVDFNYDESKSSVSFIRELYRAFRWLIEIYARNFKGHYSSAIHLQNRLYFERPQIARVQEKDLKTKQG